MCIQRAKRRENSLILTGWPRGFYWVPAFGTCIQVSLPSTITRLWRDLVGILPLSPLPSLVTRYFSYFNFPAVSLSTTTCESLLQCTMVPTVYINRVQFVTICLLCIDDSDKLLHKCKREAWINQSPPSADATSPKI